MPVPNGMLCVLRTGEALRLRVMQEHQFARAGMLPAIETPPRQFVPRDDTDSPTPEPEGPMHR
jgi:hypothetical protein